MYVFIMIMGMIMKGAASSSSSSSSYPLSSSPSSAPFRVFFCCHQSYCYCCFCYQHCTSCKYADTMVVPITTIAHCHRFNGCRCCDFVYYCIYCSLACVCDHHCITVALAILMGLNIMIIAKFCWFWTFVIILSLTLLALESPWPLMLPLH